MDDIKLYRIRRLDGRKNSWFGGLWIVMFALNAILPNRYKDLLMGALFILMGYLLIEVFRPVQMTVSEDSLKIARSVIPVESIDYIQVNRYKFTIWLKSHKLIHGWCRGKQRKLDAVDFRNWAVRHHKYKISI